jgi:hypothetical protein
MHLRCRRHFGRPCFQKCVLPSNSRTGVPKVDSSPVSMSVVSTKGRFRNGKLIYNCSVLLGLGVRKGIRWISCCAKRSIFSQLISFFSAHWISFRSAISPTDSFSPSSFVCLSVCLVVCLVVCLSVCLSNRDRDCLSSCHGPSLRCPLSLSLSVCLGCKLGNFIAAPRTAEPDLMSKADQAARRPGAAVPSGLGRNSGVNPRAGVIFSLSKRTLSHFYKREFGEP